MRKGDVMLRVSYPVFKNETWKITAGILPIYHLADDEFTDVNSERKTIEGSRGLTLNGNVFFGYEIDKSNSVELSVGAPFVTRKARPDGLTRAFVAALEYAVKF